MAAVPAVNVLRMLDALLRDCDPSMPTKDPLKLDAPSPLAVTNNLLKSSLEVMGLITKHGDTSPITYLQLSCKTAIAALAIGFSLLCLSHPLAVYRTGLVPCRCCRMNWLFPGAFLSKSWWSLSP
jgi:hypothetical protein